MCGIIGIASRTEFPSRVLLERLKRLEYRGYDSFGFYDSRNLKKRVGGIDVEAAGRTTTRMGIAHTRWATHGGVTERNAHPHVSCDGRVVIVHNGILENHEEMRKSLEKKGHRFVSETDSEVIAHFFEEGLKRKPAEAVIADFFSATAGTFAVLATIKGREEIFALKRDSPLVLGTADGMNILASDIYAFSDTISRAAFFENDEFAVVGTEKFQFFDRKGRPIEKTMPEFVWDQGAGAQ